MTVTIVTVKVMTLVTLVEVNVYFTHCELSFMVLADTQVSLLRRHGSNSPGQPFSLSLVETEDGLSSFSLFKADQPIQQYWLLCNFEWLKLHKACSMRITFSLDT